MERCGWNATGFTGIRFRFANALSRAIPFAGIFLASYFILWWKRTDKRAILLKVMIAFIVILYLAKTNYFIFPPVQTVQLS